MCGINGFNWNEPSLIEQMNILLKHRGPDDEGTYIDKKVSLGHRRLAIIDLSKRGKQPMCNEDGSLWMVQNGEIYNYIELREELEGSGHRFISETDSEVILHSYEEYGFDCLNKFNGMFAFCLYDKKKNILFLARDRFGIKPLYYFFDGERFIFSSEIKGILAHKIKRKANDKIIFDYLFHGLLDHSNETFFDGILKLMPTRYLIFDLTKKEIKIKRYWDIEGGCQREEGDVIQKVRESFTDSVKIRLRSDIPVGSCLSGGVDSSSIVCTIAELLKNEIGQFKTFSAVFPGKEVDESNYVDIVIQKRGVDAKFTYPSRNEMLNEIKEVIKLQEEPFNSTSIYAQYRVMKCANENGIRVLLDGQGSDELLAGYIPLINYYLFELIEKFRWIRFIKEFHQYAKNHKVGLLEILKYLFYIPAPKFLKYQLMKRIYAPWIDSDFFAKHANKSQNPLIDVKDLNSMLYKRLTINLIELLRYEDKNSMYFSIEARTPFLDYRLVEFICSLPSDMKVRDGTTKYIFREAMKGILPEEIRTRQDKIGFQTPEEEWFREEEVKSFVRDIIESESFRKRPYWDTKCVKKEFEEHASGNKNISSQIWKWVNLELWLREFIDRNIDS